jgi:hypothetical protein
MSESEYQEVLQSPGPLWQFSEKRVFWANKEKSPPVADKFENVILKKRIRYMLSPKIQVGSNVEILSISTVSLSSRSTRSHIISIRISFRFDSFHWVDISQFFVTYCSLVSISYQLHRQLCLSPLLISKFATRSPLVLFFVLIFVISFTSCFELKT